MHSILISLLLFQGGLIANMIMAIIVLGRRYTLSKYVSVAMITMGTAICTFASAENLVCSLCMSVLWCMNMLYMYFFPIRLCFCLY